MASTVQPPSWIDYYNEKWQREAFETQYNAYRFHLVASRAVSLARDVSAPAVLDVGCGNGWILAELNRRGLAPEALFGIEPSEVGVNNARERVPGATIVQGLLGDVNFGRTFPVVTCSEVIEHVPGDQQEQFVKLLADAVSPGGWLILTTPNGTYRDSFFSYTHAIPQPIEAWLTPRNLQAMLATAFDVQEFRSFDTKHWWKRDGGRRRLMAWSKHIPRGRDLLLGLGAVLAWRWSIGTYLYVVARRKS
jgi:2-polyprenyl-3-methyl-5-hydroxy-6-metoxy-1,4-benzoquinol methylase